MSTRWRLIQTNTIARFWTLKRCFHYVFVIQLGMFFPSLKEMKGDEAMFPLAATSSYFYLNVFFREKHESVLFASKSEAVISSRRLTYLTKNNYSAVLDCIYFSLWYQTPLSMLSNFWFICENKWKNKAFSRARRSVVWGSLKFLTGL